MSRTLLAVAAALASSPAAAGPPPDVVLVLADDLGPGDLSCSGGPTPSPHLDLMAKEGVRFTRYYAAAPICSAASRIAAMSASPGSVPMSAVSVDSTRASRRV